jgi:hypothetical protein
MGSLSAYSSTSKLPMVVLTVANLDMFLFDRQRITEINAKQHPGRLTLQPVRPLDPVSTFNAHYSRTLTDRRQFIKLLNDILWSIIIQ